MIDSDIFSTFTLQPLNLWPLTLTDASRNKPKDTSTLFFHPLYISWCFFSPSICDPRSLDLKAKLSGLGATPKHLYCMPPLNWCMTENPHQNQTKQKILRSYVVYARTLLETPVWMENLELMLYINHSATARWTYRWIVFFFFFFFFFRFSLITFIGCHGTSSLVLSR